MALSLDKYGIMSLPSDKIEKKYCTTTKIISEKSLKTEGEELLNCLLRDFSFKQINHEHHYSFIVKDEKNYISIPPKLVQQIPFSVLKPGSA